MGENFGFIIYGTKPDHFKLTGRKVSDEKIEELFEAMGWGKAEEYMDEWKYRLKSGKWVYFATYDVVETLYELGIIDEELFMDYRMMRVWKDSKECEY